MADERLAGEAVLGEAPEDLNFTLEDLDRWVNFLAITGPECPSERAVRQPGTSQPARSQAGCAVS
jgi:hypothetical protein